MEALIIYNNETVIHISARHDAYSFARAEQRTIYCLSQSEFDNLSRHEGDNGLDIFNIPWAAYPREIASRHPYGSLHLPRPIQRVMREIYDLLLRGRTDLSVFQNENLWIMQHQDYNEILDKSLLGNPSVATIETPCIPEVNRIMWAIADRYHDMEHFNEFCKITGLPTLHVSRSVTDHIITQERYGFHYRLIPIGPENVHSPSYKPAYLESRMQHDRSTIISPTPIRRTESPTKKSNTPSAEGAALIRGETSDDTVDDLLKTIDDLIKN